MSFINEALKQTEDAKLRNLTLVKPDPAPQSTHWWPLRLKDLKLSRAQKRLLIGAGCIALISLLVWTITSVALNGDVELGPSQTASLSSSVSDGASQGDNSRRTAPVFRRGTFHLSAVVRGPYGEGAVVNGQVVSVGSTVGGAKVVSIGKKRVELTFMGRRIILNM